MRNNIGIITAIFVLILAFLLLVNYKGTAAVTKSGASALGSTISHLQGFNSGTLHSVG